MEYKEEVGAAKALIKTDGMKVAISLMCNNDVFRSGMKIGIGFFKSSEDRDWFF